MNKYIKKLVIRDLDSVMDDEIELNFSPRVNVIIGVRGGGKSTLLDFLWAMNKGVEPSARTRAIFKEYKMEPVRIEYSTGEVINYSGLSKSNWTKSAGYRDLNTDDIIAQDDNIKTRIHDSKEIKGLQKSFVAGALTDDVYNDIKKMKVFFDSCQEVSKLSTQKINWSYICKTVDTKGAFNMTEVFPRYLPRVYQDIRTQNSQVLRIAALASVLNKELENFNNSDKMNNHLNENTRTEVIKNLEELEKFSNNFSVEFLNKMTIANEFERDINNVIKKNTDKSRAEDNVQHERNSVRLHFDKLGKELATNKFLFNNIVSKGLKVKVFNEQWIPEWDGARLSLDATIHFSKDVDDKHADIYSLLKKMLKSQSDKHTWFKWVLKFINDGFNKNTMAAYEDIKASVEKELLKHIEVKIDDMNYESMSLGQRSSWGIENKLKKFDSNTLFLDQLEENLDNYTIFHKLLPIVNGKASDKQVFMVTHNGNLGINLVPDKVIVSEIKKGNLQESYKEIELKGMIQYMDKKINPLGHFLEGGIDALKRRIEILEKEISK